MTTEMLYKVYDCEENKFIDVRDLDKDLCVIDSTTFFDRKHSRKFTTISFKSKVQ